MSLVRLSRAMSGVLGFRRGSAARGARKCAIVRGLNALGRTAAAESWGADSKAAPVELSEMASRPERLQEGETYEMSLGAFAQPFGGVVGDETLKRMRERADSRGRNVDFNEPEGGPVIFIKQKPAGSKSSRRSAPTGRARCCA